MCDEIKPKLMISTAMVVETNIVAIVKTGISLQSPLCTWVAMYIYVNININTTIDLGQGIKGHKFEICICMHAEGRVPGHGNLMT